MTEEEASTLNVNDESGKPSLFAHPATFLLTHVLLPLMAVAAFAYVLWISFGELAGGLAGRGIAWLAASALFPASAACVLLARPRRLGARLMAAYAFAGAAFLYLAVPVFLEMCNAVDAWIVGPTPMLALFTGVIPLIFAGIARIATADWRMMRGADIATAAMCIIFPPVAAYLFGDLLSRLILDLAPGPLAKAVLSHLFAAAFFVGTAVFFVGILRVAHRMHAAIAGSSCEATRRIVGALLFGFALPLCGLALNRRIPFPADFDNPWPWALSVATGLVLLLPARSGASGLAAYFLKFLVAPFVVYFFVLFLPFLPLAILAILAVGAGFLMLAPTLLFRFWTREAYAAYAALRPDFSRRSLVLVALAASLVMPAAFVADVEVERRDLAALLAWHADEDFDAPPAPMPVSQKRAEKIMKGVNDFTFGAEIPFLSAWRTWRVYGGMYMADKLRNELNLRILGRKVDDHRDWSKRSRNFFGGAFFGMSEARRSPNRGGPAWWKRRPPRTDAFSAEARHDGGQDEARYVVSVRPVADGEGREFIADLALPAGAWVEGMRLKMTNGVWKTARPSERKAAEWVYGNITELRLDPSLVTLDTPTAGTVKVFPVGKEGREVELAIRLPSPAASPFVATLNGKPVANPLHPATDAASIYVADGADVSVVPEAWMAEHEQELVAAASGEAERFDIGDPGLKGRLRRRLRAAARGMGGRADGVVPRLVFAAGGGADAKAADILSTNVLSKADLAVLRRELPGVAELGDRPLDGWFFLDGEGGGKVAVPYRRGDGGAVVFARLKGAEKVGGAWAEGAKAWELENAAFLRPALDVRRELLEATRRTGVLTTKSAYIVVETSAQEKGLKEKEAKALGADKSLDFDESTAEKSDAPGFALLALALLGVALLRAATARRAARL